MKRISFFLAVFLILCAMTGCSMPAKQAKSHNLTIVASLFPQYDFARAIAGDLAEVILLLPPGAESHSFEPTPADVIAINEADLFVYTGDVMESWAASLLEGLESDTAILDMSAGIPLCDHEGQTDHHHDVDPHIFTNPCYAIRMAQSLEDKLCQLDPSHSEIYRSRGAAYREELAALDRDFRETVSAGVRNKLIFGGRFAFLYFTEEYGLTYDSAYDSCSSETEPAAADIARIIDTVKSENIPVVYYEELSNGKTAKLICDETGAKPLLFHSCHNVSEEELASGVTYLSLMQMNLNNLKEGLS